MRMRPKGDGPRPKTRILAQPGKNHEGLKLAPALPCALVSAPASGRPPSRDPMRDPVLREPAGIVRARRTVEGGGFVVRRPFPTPELALFDPFLLLDEMGPVDYAPGQGRRRARPPASRLRNRHLSARRRVRARGFGRQSRPARSGDIQWMTAGRGVVHSEMPSARVREEGGRVHGFQLWVNLPSRDKMTAPRYQDVTAATLPVATGDDGKATVKVIAGNALGVAASVATRTPIQYFDVTLAAGRPRRAAGARRRTTSRCTCSTATRASDPHHDAESGAFVILGDGDAVEVSNAADATAPARLLVLGGEPLNEPVARYGPFVMNTEAEIHQAIDDFRSGRFGDIARES